MPSNLPRPPALQNRRLMTRFLAVGSEQWAVSSEQLAWFLRIGGRRQAANAWCDWERILMGAQKHNVFGCFMELFVSASRNKPHLPIAFWRFVE